MLGLGRRMIDLSVQRGREHSEMRSASRRCAYPTPRSLQPLNASLAALPFFCSAIVNRPTTLNGSSSMRRYTPPGSSSQ
jgi:hypothetical protein